MERKMRKLTLSLLVIATIFTVVLFSACNSTNSPSTKPPANSTTPNQGGGGVIPERIAPIGTINEKNPTYILSKIEKATKYQYQIYQGDTRIFDVTVSSNVCRDTQCSDKPNHTLDDGNYQWRVCAFIDGVWRSASPFTEFTVSSK